MQVIRDNMKGTLAVVVVLMFVVPMVLSGIGTSFLGGPAGGKVATVDGRDISNNELARAVYMQKQRLLSQEGVDPSADYLKDENLRGPVLQQLIRRTALIASAEDSGVGVSETSINKTILDQQSFHAEGKFDKQTYRRVLSGVGYTPATFKASLSEDLLISQIASGIQVSSFVTPAELDAIVSVVGEARSFEMIKVPATAVGEDIEPTTEEISAYYYDNQTTYLDPEKMSVEYVELSVDELAKHEVIAEADIRSQYDQEIMAFDSTPDVEIAHILIEDGDGAAEKLSELQSKLDAGEEFEALVESYSDDIGSKSSNGYLGLLTPGAFPEEFTPAVVDLEEGQVSTVVKTDAGSHILKVVKKTVKNAPSFEDRKDVIKAQLARATAEEAYFEMLEELGDLTYSAEGLGVASKELGLTIKESEEFTRSSGTGIASNKAVRDAAFNPVVVSEGQNSQTIEISAEKAVVVRKKTHSPERIKALDEVKEQITGLLKERIKQEKLQSLADALITELKSGADAKEKADEAKYEYSAHDKVKRTDVTVDRSALRQVFAMPAVDGKSYKAEVDMSGDYLVTVLTEVVAGARTDMPPQQLFGMTAQLKRENGQFENASYEADVVEKAETKFN